MSDLFSSVPVLLLTPPDSQLLSLLQEADRLVRRHPEIIESIEQDLDRHGKAKKVLRMQDCEWQGARSLSFDMGQWEPTPVSLDKVRLAGGRPRTSAYVVYVFLVGRGYYGGFKSIDAMTLLRESATVLVMLANLGMTMPASSTLCELTNAVSNKTREMILDAQIKQVLDEKFDDFETLLIDSTSVHGNSKWPNESHLMVYLVNRLLHRGAKLDRFELAAFDDPYVRKLVSKMTALDKRISMDSGKPGSKAQRNKMYRKMLTMARRAHKRLLPDVQTAEQALNSSAIAPSRRHMADRLVQSLREDIHNLQVVIDSCHARIVNGAKVPVAEKLLSISDPDAGLIVKGGREAVIGYKPQLGRSGAGFVISLIVPQGNASDSSQLIAMVQQQVERTNITPTTVSVDDGYSSVIARADRIFGKEFRTK